MQYILFVGLQNYCRFGTWSKEENQQLKKNWKKVTKVTHGLIHWMYTLFVCLLLIITLIIILSSLDHVHGKGTVFSYLLVIT